MSIRQTHTLNTEITNERISRPYPHVEILEPSDALALALPEMDKGDLPVLCTINGSTRRLINIKRSAVAIRDLALITKLKFHKDAETSFELDSIDRIMEALM